MSKMTLEQKLKVQRVSDVFSVVTLSWVTIPVIAFAAAASYRELKRNPFYFQERVGYKGRKFNIVKIRTMRDLEDIDPSGALKNRYVSMDEKEKAAFDKAHRIGPMGRFLRKSRLDELPQIFNVLKGEMSIVGPRPHKAEDTINEKYKKRQQVRPGITGDGKVAGLNSISHDEEGRIDEDYVKTVKDRSVVYMQFYRTAVCWATPWALLRHRRANVAYCHKL